MKIIIEKPPVWDDVVEMIGAEPRNAIFAWGDTIYNPEGIAIPDYLMVHEGVHQKQQAEIGGPEVWWSRYIDDLPFRVQQEVEAYHTQFKFMCKIWKDRNRQNDILVNLGNSLAGPLYGRPVSPMIARAWILTGKCV